MYLFFPDYHPFSVMWSLKQCRQYGSRRFNLFKSCIIRQFLLRDGQKSGIWPPCSPCTWIRLNLNNKDNRAASICWKYNDVLSIVVMGMSWILIVKHLKETTPTQNKHLRHWNTSLLKELRTSTFHKLGTIIILQSKDLILLLWQLDVELNVVRSSWIANYKGFRFLFEFIWSKSLVTKQNIRTKFITRL